MAGAPAEKSPVVAYADNRLGAEAAAQVAREVTGQHGLAARVSVECWLPVKGRWEDASALSQRDLAEERDDQPREDRRLSAETGIAQWRVRAELRTHRDAVALARRLSAEGHQVIKGWKSVLAFANTVDDANRLAEQTRLYAPADAAVRAEQIAQWRVRAELRTHRDAVALAQRLSAEGHQVIRRGMSVLAGADTEDDANRLAEQTRLYAPADAAVRAERTDAPDYSSGWWPGGPDLPMSPWS